MTLTNPIPADQLPALLVVIPILASTLPLILSLKWDRVGWPVSITVCAGLLAATLALAHAVYTTPMRFGQPPVVHELGGFPRPIGIELVADPLSTIVVLLIMTVSVAVLLYIRRLGPRDAAFHSAFLLLVGGLNGVTLTGDVFNLFVFLEITGLATYALVARGETPKAATAALKYLVLGTVGASVYLVGVGFLYVATGTLNMIDLATAIPATAGYTDPLVRAAFALIFIGFAVKVAQWPLHSWQPDAYQHAPDGVTVFISALVSTVAAYALIRVAFGVFTVDFFHATPYASEIVLAIGTLSVIAGSVLAVIQRDVKRMFAYSSVSQFGLIVLAIGLVNPTALLGGIVHLIGHGIMKGGLFAGAGAAAAAVGARTVDDFQGLAKDHPIIAASIAILGITLIGIPPSIGFIGKWLIAVGSVEAGVWPVAAVVFFSTLFTLAYIARLLEKMYFEDLPASRPARTRPLIADGGRRRIPPAALLIPVVLAIAAVGLGFAGAEFDLLLGEFVDEVFDP